MAPSKGKFRGRRPGVDQHQDEDALHLALIFYYSNRDVRTSKIQKMADGRTRTINTKGISIRRVATMRQVPISGLQRVIASGGLSALKTHSEAIKLR